MKNIFSILIWILLLSSNIPAQQYNWYSVHDSYISNDVKFLSRNVVIATGNGGKIYRSTNSGINWTEMSIGSSGQRFHEIEVIDSLTAIMCGFNNAVFKTTNSGLNWFGIAPQGHFHHYYTISFLNSQTGIVAGGKIFLTTNGGSDWTLRANTNNTVFYGSDFSEASIIYLVGDSSRFVYPSTNYYGIVTYSSDYGETWVRTYSSSPSNTLRSISFLNANTGIAAGHQRLIKTTDGGNNWSEQSFTLNNYYLRNAIYLNPSIVYAMGSEGFYDAILLKSTNGGNNWFPENLTNISPHPRTLWGIDFFNDSLGVTSGDDRILRTTHDIVIPGDTNSAKYFPLSVGNSWTYLAVNQFYQSYYYKKTVYRDTIINNKKYFFYGSHQNNGEWIRYDSIKSNLLVFSTNGGCSFYSNDRIIDSLAAKKNDNINCQYQTYFTRECIDTSDATIFNTTVKSKSFRRDGLTFGIVTYAQNFGIISSCTGEPPPCNGYSTLVGCVIDGTVYGDTSMAVRVKQVGELIPEKYFFYQNFPNPFNPSTTISFDIPQSAFVKLTVYDALGREVATLVNENLPAGSYNYRFTTDNYQLPSGIYFYHLSAGDFSETKRMVLLK